MKKGSRIKGGRCRLDGSAGNGQKRLPKRLHEAAERCNQHFQRGVNRAQIVIVLKGDNRFVEKTFFATKRALARIFDQLAEFWAEVRRQYRWQGYILHCVQVNVV